MSGEAYRRGVGRLGEDLALRELQDLGYRLVQRNYRVRGGEIDLIMRDGEVCVFVEVKTRQSDRYGAPGEAVDYRKRERMIRAAGQYLSGIGGWDSPARFDVVEVTGRDGQWVISHIRDAFAVEA